MGHVEAHVLPGRMGMGIAFSVAKEAINPSCTHPRMAHPAVTDKICCYRFSDASYPVHVSTSLPARQVLRLQTCSHQQPCQKKPEKKKLKSGGGEDSASSGLICCLPRNYRILRRHRPLRLPRRPIYNRISNPQTETSPLFRASNRRYGREVSD